MDQTFKVSFVECPEQGYNVLVVHGASDEMEFNRCKVAHWFCNDWASIPGEDGAFDLAFKMPAESTLNDAVEDCWYEWADETRQRVRKVL